MQIKYLVYVLLVSASMLAIAGCGGGGGGGSAAGAAISSIPDNIPSNPPDNPSSPTSSVTLSWDAPTENTDGSPYTDPDRYRVYYNLGSDSNAFTVPANFSESAYINGAYTESTISNLTVGTSWCFAVAAVDTSGNESDLSTVICATIP